MDDLVERDEERAVLDQELAAALAGAGRVVVIEAPAGIGKTRLLRTLRDAPARVLSARGSELESRFAFGVVHQLLDSAVAETSFEGAARLAEPIFAGTARPGGAEELFPLLHGLTWVVSALAPVVLLCDDAQWADEPSLRFLSLLAKRIDDLPVLLAVAMRPPESAELIELASHARVLRPQALSAAGVRRFLHDADPAFARACHEATGGNPFYLGELVREIEDRRLARDPAQVAGLAPRGVTRRLAALAPEALATARAAAVFPDAGGTVDGIVEDGEFVHPIVRAAVYAGIPAAERSAAHARAAATLVERGAQPELIAAHLLETAPAGDRATVKLLRDAAARARRLGGAESAAAYLARALAEPPPVADRVELLIELGTAEARAGRADALWHLEEAIVRAPNEPICARAGIELARVLQFRGEAVRAVPILQQRRLRAPAVGPALTEELEVELLGLAYLSVGARALLAERTRALIDPGGEPRTRLEAFTLAALAFDAAAAGTSADRVADLATRALAGGLLPPDLLGGGYGVLIAGVALLWADRLDEAARLYADLRAEAQRQGSAVLLAAAAGQSALVNERRGALAEAAADAAEALQVGREVPGAQALLSVARAAAVLVALRRGEVPDADLVEGTSDATDPLPFMLVLYARAELRLARGDVDAGLEDLLACGRHGRSWGAVNPAVAPWRSRAAAIGGDPGLAAEELALAEAFGAPIAIGVAQRAAGQLERAVATLERTPARLELAYALVDLGAALRRRGRRAEARPPLARGQQLATECGAAPLAARAQEELLAAGARPRRIALSGRDALTPSERRVAGLAAQGLTNRAIAQQLFVTEKTVETHLRGAFQKLDISSRTQLPDALRRGTDALHAYTPQSLSSGAGS